MPYLARKSRQIRPPSLFASWPALIADNSASSSISRAYPRQCQEAYVSTVDASFRSSTAAPASLYGVNAPRGKDEGVGHASWVGVQIQYRCRKDTWPARNSSDDVPCGAVIESQLTGRCFDIVLDCVHRPCECEACGQELSPALALVQGPAAPNIDVVAEGLIDKRSPVQAL